MAKSLTHINVFLASPSDLQDERKAVAAAIVDLNNTLRTTMNICLDLVSWETHAYPSVGIDAQDVINNQVDDYDIFLGLMWGRFGTQTGRAGSGTEEEFDRAYNRWRLNTNNTKIMLYFSAKPIAIDDIDFIQIQKVKQFKNKVEGLGVLHWSFSDTESLVQMLKVHLPHHVKDIVVNGGQSNDVDVAQKNNSFNALEIANDEVDELGFWDLMEVFHDSFSEMHTVMENFANNINELTDSMNDSTEKLSMLQKRGNLKPIEVKIIIDKFSRGVSSYVNKNKVELDRFNELYNNGLNSFIDALAMAEEIGNLNYEDLNGLSLEVANARDSIKSVAKNAKEFKAQIKGFPPMSKSLNSAKRILEISLDGTIKEFSGCVKMLSELHDVIQEKIEKINLDENNTGAFLAE